MYARVREYHRGNPMPLSVAKANLIESFKRHGTMSRTALYSIRTGSHNRDTLLKELESEGLVGRIHGTSYNGRRTTAYKWTGGEQLPEPPSITPFPSAVVVQLKTPDEHYESDTTESVSLPACGKDGVWLNWTNAQLSVTPIKSVAEPATERFFKHRISYLEARVKELEEVQEKYTTLSGNWKAIKDLIDHK